MTNKDLVIGGKYNWINQSERLIYLGHNLSGNGYWHQFALTHTPQKVWCELQDTDLHMIEETNKDDMPELIQLIHDKYNVPINGVDGVQMCHMQLVINTVREYDKSHIDELNAKQKADLQREKLALLESFMKHTLVKRNLTGRESGCLYDDLAKSIQSKVE